MLEPTMEEMLKDAGASDIEIDQDEQGLVAKAKFPGTEEQLETRLGADFDITANPTIDDEPLRFRCRPRE